MANNSALQIKTSFILDTNVPTITIQDTTNYSLLTDTVNSVKGILTINLENGLLIYQNIDYQNPDIVSAGGIKSGILLPLSLGKVIAGIYRINYKLLVNGTEYVNNFTYEYSYKKVEADLSLTIDGYSSTVQSSDNTNYSGAGTIESLTRTFTVTPPLESPLSITTTSSISISYPANIWSGTWVSTLSTQVIYNINNIHIQDTIYKEISDIAYKADMNIVRVWVMDYQDYYKSLLGSNLALAEKIQNELTKVNTYMDLYDKSLANADVFTAYLCIYNVIKIVSKDLTIDSEEIIPFILVITTPTDDKWTRNGTNLYPKNQETISLGRNNPVSTEKLSINGTMLSNEYWIGSDNTMRIYRQGSDLVFTDGTITKKLSELGGNVDLSNYIKNDNATWVSVVNKSHNAVTLNSGESVLTLNDQLLGINRASSTTDGYLSKSDYEAFFNKQDQSDILNSLSTLGLGTGILIGNGTGFQYLSNPSSNPKVVTWDGSQIVWSDPSGGGDYTFTVPEGTIRISNEIGDITNANYTDVSTLNGKTLNYMIQKFIFPAPKIPDWISPTSILSAVTNPTISSSYVECGSTKTVTLSASFTSPSNYAIVTGTTTYTQNGTSFTNGSSVTFSSLGNYNYIASVNYIANMSTTITLSDGSTITPDQLNGYPSTRILTPTKTLVSIDPIFIGCVSGISSWSTIDWTTIKSQLTEANGGKVISSEPSSALTLNVATYNTSIVDPTKWIIVAYPASYGDLSKILYVEASNSDVLAAGTFTKMSGTLTRTDSGTSAYYLYYAQNRYCTGGSVTYKVNW